METEAIFYNLVYTMTETSDPLNPVVSIRTFSYRGAAAAALEAEYSEMLKDIENGNTVLDCVRKEKSVDNTTATIELGFESTDETDAGIPEVETRHSWKVEKSVIDPQA